MNVLICGDRNYTDRESLFAYMNWLHDCVLPQIDSVVEGEARGADTLGCKWAESRNIPVKKFPADWTKYGKAAGPIRNQQMLDEGRPDIVVAFHKDIGSSKGTLDMVVRANKAGIPVIVYAGTY